MRHIFLFSLFLFILCGCRHNTAHLSLAEKNLEEARALLKSDNYEDALNLYYQTLDLLEREEVKDSDVHTAIYTDLGSLYKSQGMYKNALEVYRDRYNLIARNPNPDDMALALRDIALTNLYLKHVDSCYIYLEQAFDYASHAKDSIIINDMLNNDMSLYFNQMEEYEQSLCHLKTIEHPSDEIFANKGYVFMKLHENDSARYNLLKATESDILHIKSSAYCSLAELEGDLGNYQLAYSYLNTYQQILDSIQQQLHTDEINSLVFQNISDKFAAEMRLRYQWLFSSLVFIVVVAGIVLFFLFQLHNRKKKIAQQEQENELLRKEKKILELNDLNYRNFKEKPIYKRIMELEEAKEILNFKGQDMLKTEFNFYFQHLIKELKAACPELTDDDIFLCCLYRLGLSPNSIMLCMGHSDTAAVRQRKHRIKRKMSTNDQGKELYKSIFNSPESPE